MKKDIPVYDISTISEFRKEDILISRFAPYLDTHPNLCLPHKHNFFHMLLFTKGSGHHAIDFKDFPVKPFQVYFMIPGQVHSWNFQGEVDGFVINCSLPFFRSFLLNPNYLEQFSFFSGAVDDCVIQLPDDIQPQVLRLFNSLLSESETAGLQSMDMIRVLLVQLFITVARLHTGNTSKQQHGASYAVFKKFLALIEQHLTDLKLPSEYAPLLHITPNHLNSVCNTIMGKSAGEIIRDRVVLEAKRMIVNVDLSIAEIAYKLNFKDASYFSRFFKKYTGQSPEEFRHKALQVSRQ